MKKFYRRQIAILLFASLGSLAASATDLQTVINDAIANDPRTQSAQLERQIMESRDDQALGALLPQLRAYSTLSLNRRRIMEDNFFGDIREQEYPGKRFGGSLTQVLFNWDAFKNKESSALRVKQYEYLETDALSTVMLDVSERYIAVLSARDDLTLVRSEKESVENQLLQFERLYERGLVRVTDLLDVQTRRDTVIADEIEAENRVDIAREALIELTDTNLGKLATLQQSVQFPVLSMATDTWVEKAIASNKQLKALKKSKDAAKANYDRMVGGHYPTLDLQLTVTDSDTGFESASVNRNRTSVASINLNVPLYSGGTTSARASEAYSQWELEKLEYDRVRREVTKMVREAFLNAKSANQRITANQYRVESAEKSYQAMNESFKRGVVTVTDVMSALDSKYQAHRDLQQARYNYLNNWMQLMYLSGQLTPQTITQVNDMLVTAE